MRPRRALQRALLGLVAAACIALPASAQRVDAVATDVFPLPAELGPPPAVNPQDYDPFVGAGPVKFVVQIRVKLRDGKFVDQTNPDNAFLYPDTAFTRWLLRRYAADANGASDFQHAWPGARQYPVPVPAVLLPRFGERTAPLTAVRAADECAANGICTFRRMQPGRYWLYAKIYQSRWADLSETNLEPMLDPLTGELEPHLSVTKREGYVATGGFVLLSHGYYDLVPPARYASLGSVRPAAYFRVARAR